MLGIALGWKLLAAGAASLFLAAILGVWTYDRPDRRRLRIAAAILAVVAVATVIVIVGPGPWCGDGDAYRVPGCA